MSEVLKKILQDAKKALADDQRFLAIFDLDSTLFDTKDRQKKIVLQFAENSENIQRWPSETAKLRQIAFQKKDYGIAEALMRLGFSFEADREFIGELQKYWELWFFHNDFLKHDTPMPGAVEFVKALEALDADILYLTARDIPRMFDGTVKSLAQVGFPVTGDHIQIQLKKNKDIEDAEYKTEVIKRIGHRYHRVWFFENEPVILNAVSRLSPNVNLVFIDTCHSGREALHEEIDSIPHFDINIDEFREFFIER